MDKVSVILFDVLQTSGVLAPLAFIFFHVLRQFIFVPAGLVCILGGVFFGAVYGAVYSLVGVTLTSICFYVLFKRVPSLFKKLFKLKKKWFGKTVQLSVGQMAILRLIPFVHFHLISLCLIEATSGFREYTKASVMANFPLAVIYTVFGQWMGHLSFQWVVAILAGLSVLFYLLRKKELLIKWDDFFEAHST